MTNEAQCYIMLYKIIQHFDKDVKETMKGKNRKMSIVVREAQYQFLSLMGEEKDMKMSALIRNAIELLKERTCKEKKKMNNFGGIS